MQKLLCVFILVFIFICTSCESDTTYHDSYIHHQEKVSMKTYSVDEIYVGGTFEDTLISPAYERMCIYPNDKFIYLFFSNWSSVYIKEDGTIGTLEEPFCYDPLCSHSDISCLSYVSGGSTQLVGYDGKAYMLTQGSEPGQTNFIVYDLSSGKFDIIEQYPNGGQMITRLGRFIYYWIQEVIVNDSAPVGGKQDTVRHYYRYDLDRKKTDYLGKKTPDKAYRRVSAVNGVLYYLGDDYNLWTCDYNLQNDKKIIAEKVVTYEIINGNIYYLTSSGTSAYGKLYCYDLYNNTDETLYENIVWFCADNGILYYSQYSPIQGFEWDIWKSNDQGVQVLTPHTITVEHGNQIYAVPVEKVGTKGHVLPVCQSYTEDDLYFGAAYAVYNGILFTQYKESYTDGIKKGMKTGMLIFNIETGVECRTNTEIVMN